MQWYDEYCHFQRRHGRDGEIKSAPATGVVNCYLGLAYSLYLVKHNVELQDRLQYTIGQFLDWCQRAGFRGLEDIEPITVAAYVEQHPGSPATIKQHISAIRMLFSWLLRKAFWP